MYHVMLRRESDKLLAALKELDAAKALMRKSESDVGNAVSAIAARHSRASLNALETLNLATREAGERYRRAVESFNAACHNPARSRIPGGN